MKNLRILIISLVVCSCGSEEFELFESENLVGKKSEFSITDECHQDNREKLAQFNAEISGLNYIETSNAVTEIATDTLKLLSIGNSGGFSGSSSAINLQTQQIAQRKFLDYNGYCDGLTFSKGSVIKTTQDTVDIVKSNIKNLKIKSFSELDLPLCDDATNHFPLEYLYFYDDQNNLTTIINYAQASCKNTQHDRIEIYHGFVDESSTDYITALINALKS